MYLQDRETCFCKCPLPNEGEVQRCRTLEKSDRSNRISWTEAYRVHILEDVVMIAVKALMMYYSIHQPGIRQSQRRYWGPIDMSGQSEPATVANVLKAVEAEGRLATFFEGPQAR